jgi:hypothetical protein
LKLLSRLNWNERLLNNLTFFPGNELDYKGLGFILSKTGSCVYVPASHLAQNEIDIQKYLPNGFSFLSQNFKWNQFNNNDLEKTLLLSDDAKNFGIVRELNSIKHPLSLYYVVCDFLCAFTAYLVCFSFNRRTMFRTSFLLRLSIYTVSSILAIGFALSIRKLLQIYHENQQDKKTIFSGIDMAEGSIEYYEKMLERNKLIRQVMYNGNEYIDESGNLIKDIYKVPFFDIKFEYPTYGIPLNQRKENCEKLLNKYIETFNEKKPDRELDIMKKIREKWTNRNKNEK